MAFERSSLRNDFGDPAGEARACRAESALFDFSFLECARLTGRDALPAVEAYVQRPLGGLAQGAIAYAIRCDQSGAALADLTVWRSGPDSFDVMSGRREDIAALLASASAQIDAASLGEDRAVFAVQGPRALDALRGLGNVDKIAGLPYFRFTQVELAGAHCTVGRLGYTGEAGFEIILPRHEAPRLWGELARRSWPAGFIAADTLRIEAGFVLFANEFRLPASPAEAGLQQFSSGPQKTGLKLVSFQAKADRLSLPWVGNSPLVRPVEPGTIAVTSACNSAVANGVLGLGFVTASTTAEAVLHDPADEFHDIRQVPRPYFDTSKRRPRLPWR